MAIETSWREALAGVLLIGACSGASAETFHTFDPATLAQGGTGVAMPDPASQALSNPAALSAMPEDSDFNLAPSFAGRAFDQDELLEAIDDFQQANHVDETEASINQTEQELEEFANTPNQKNRDEAVAALRDTADNTEDLNNGLQSITGKPVEGEFAGALAASVPGRTLGIGLSYKAFATVSGTTTYDDTFLSQVASDLDTCANQLDNGSSCDENNLSFLADSDGDGQPDTIRLDPENDLNSRVFGRGIAVEEVGLTLSHEFNLGVPIAIGVTPKSQDVQVFDYVATADDADGDDLDSDRFTEEYSNFNLDLGALATFGPIRAGLTVRNAVEQDYETALGNTVTLEPQARAGVAFDADWFRIGADVDLTRNASTGFADDSRFVSVGTTIDILGWVQLRGGYRVNTINDARSTASVGLGLSPFEVVRVEVGVAGNDDEVGGAATVGVTF